MGKAIRPAHSKDVERLVRLDKEANKEDKQWIPQTAEDFSRTIRGKGRGMMVCAEAGRLRGYLDYRIINETPSISRVWIDNIYVAKGARRQGIAGGLVKALENRMKGRKRSIVMITSDRNMPIFEKIGFKKEMNYMRLVR